MSFLPEEKYSSLVQDIKTFLRVAVAFSGGVDSSLLYNAAIDAIGVKNVFVLHAVSELTSSRERNSAENILRELQPPAGNAVELILSPFLWPEFVANTAERCYFCKKRMYKAFLLYADQKGCSALLDGSNVDDLKSKRPGFRAIHELGVETPLLDAGLSKREIRFLAERAGLSNHNKPSNSCLATRVPEGTAISREKLQLVEKCESFLLDKGFLSCRVRVEEEDAVMQLTAVDCRNILTDAIRVDLLYFMQDLGFARVLLDVDLRV